MKSSRPCNNIPSRAPPGIRVGGGTAPCSEASAAARPRTSESEEMNLERKPGKLCGAAWARGRRSRSSSCEAGYLTINLINDNQGSSAEVLGAWQEKMRSSRCAAGYLTDKLTNDNWRSSVEQLGCVAGGNV